MIASVATALLAACPQAETYPTLEQQTSVCRLVERHSAVDVDRAALDRLLADPEFARLKRPPQTAWAEWWEQIWAQLREWLQTSSAENFANSTPYTVLALAIAAVLASAWRYRRTPGSARGGPQAPTAVRSSLAPPWQVPLRRARELLDSSPPQAIRAALDALLCRLETSAAPLRQRALTNRELGAQLARGQLPPGWAELAAPLQAYDRALYSLQAIGRAHAEQFIAAVERLR